MPLLGLSGPRSRNAVALSRAIRDSWAHQCGLIVLQLVELLIGNLVTRSCSICQVRSSLHVPVGARNGLFGLFRSTHGLPMDIVPLKSA